MLWFRRKKSREAAPVPTPSPSRELVIEKARRIFPQRDLAEVMQVLDAAVAPPYVREKERVQLAVLKLCEERVGVGPPKWYFPWPHDLESLAQAAKTDYRDVILWAQYPRQIFECGPRKPATPEDIAADEAQWQAWLSR